MQIKDRLFYIVMPAALFSGLLLGATFACRTDTTALFTSAKESFASPTLPMDSFVQALFQNLSFSALLFFLGTTVLGPLPAALLLGARGYAVGFSVAALVASFGFRGFCAALCGIFPHTALYIPFFCFLAMHGARFSGKLLKGGTPKPVHLPGYIFSSLILTLPILLGCFWEGYISAPLLRTILGAHV